MRWQRNATCKSPILVRNAHVTARKFRRVAGRDSVYTCKWRIRTVRHQTNFSKYNKQTFAAAIDVIRLWPKSMNDVFVGLLATRLCIDGWYPVAGGPIQYEAEKGAGWLKPVTLKAKTIFVTGSERLVFDDILWGYRDRIFTRSNWILYRSNTRYISTLSIVELLETLRL